MGVDTGNFSALFYSAKPTTIYLFHAILAFSFRYGQDDSVFFALYNQLPAKGIFFRQHVFITGAAVPGRR